MTVTAGCLQRNVGNRHRLKERIGRTLGHAICGLQAADAIKCVLKFKDAPVLAQNVARNRILYFVFDGRTNCAELGYVAWCHLSTRLSNRMSISHILNALSGSSNPPALAHARAASASARARPSGNDNTRRTPSFGSRFSANHRCSAYATFCVHSRYPAFLNPSSHSFISTLRGLRGPDLPLVL